MKNRSPQMAFLILAFLAFTLTACSGTSDNRFTFSTTTFDESLLNDGTIQNSVEVTLNSGEFFKPAGNLIKNTHYYLLGNALPAGLELVFTITSANTATISLTNAATDHEAMNSANNIEVNITADALLVYSGNVSTIGTESFAIDFLNVDDGPNLSYSGDLFSETGDNDGAITDQIEVQVTNDTFVENVGILQEGIDYTLSGDAIPNGLTLVTELQSNTKATLSLAGNAVSHLLPDSVNVTLTFPQTTFSSGIAAQNGSNVKEFRIHFDNEEGITLFSAERRTWLWFPSRIKADQTCRDYASNFFLNHANYRAFISLDSSDSIASMPANYGVPVNLKIQSVLAKKIANDWSDLLDGTINQSLWDAGVLKRSWWSHSASDGTFSGVTCKDSDWGTTGSYNATDENWISQGITDCYTYHTELLCVGFD